ncbi:MAG TPA: autotransporter-associated beta strand repeat-containing protein, partial [Pirellulales bacterium]|nr:autotransporter-associated beta strand repeat-containing protein [Pirellulales bacterium]
MHFTQKMRRYCYGAAVVLTCGIFLFGQNTGTARAALTQTVNQSSANNAFVVPTTAQNLLASATLSATPAAPSVQEGATSNTWTTLTDGSFGTYNSRTGSASVSSPSPATTLTYTLDTSSALDSGGYTISAVDIFSGWQDTGRSQQNVSIYYTTVGNSTYTLLATDAPSPLTNSNSVFVSYTDSTNLSGSTSGTPILSGVNSIQFVFGTQQLDYVGYRELSVLGAAIPAAGTIWTGGTSSDWGVGANWQGGVVPTGAVTFGTAATNGTVDLTSANETTSGITFIGAVNTTILSTGGKTLTLDNGSSAANIASAGLNSISNAISLNSNVAINAALNSTLTISGPISEAASGKSLSVAGSGTVVLSATNSYTGGTNINGGTLNIVGGALGTTGNVSFGGGTLQYKAATTPLDLSGRIKNSTGAINVDLNGNSVTYASSIDSSNTGGLNVTSTATGAVVNLNASNGYTGGTTIGTNVTANLGDTNALAGGSVTVNGGTVNLNGNNTTVSALSGTGGAITDNSATSGATLLTVNQGTNTTFAGTIGGGANRSIGLTKSGSGALTLTGQVNLGTNVPVLSGGTLNLANNNNTIGAGSITVGAGNTLGAGSGVAGSSSALGSASVHLTGGTLAFNTAGGTTGIALKFATNATSPTYAVTGTAGVAPLPNWNNLSGVNGSSVAIHDSNSVAAGSVTWTNPGGTYAVFGSDQANQNAQVLNGYLDHTAGGTSVQTFTVSGIPYASYTAYVYFASDGNNRMGNVSANGTTYYYQTYVNNGGFVGFIPTTDTTGATNPTANYAVFTGLSGSTFNLSQMETFNNGVSAIEIVSS